MINKKPAKHYIGDRELAGVKCECAEPQCVAHRLHSSCNQPATDFLFRVDMTDETGTAMCEACATDAFESGLFTAHEDEDD
jgi:hypothetical protein